MIRMAKRLFRWEQKRLRKKTEEAKRRKGVSAALFLEGEMNALADADCFFFYGGRMRPKGLLTMFFPDEEHAEITVAEFLPGGGGLPELYKCALRECERIGIEQIHTVRNPAHGFDTEHIKGICLSHAWSEYMLRIEMKGLAVSGGHQTSSCRVYGDVVISREEAPEGDGTLRYELCLNGQKAAECRILPVDGGRRCYLFGLKTKEGFRRQGMATRLLTEIAKEYMGTDGAVLRLQVSSKNEPAERLYRKLGFATEEELEYYKTEEC